MPRFKILFAALLLLCSVGPCTSSGYATQPLPERAEPREKRQPNILLILCDDLGFSDLGCYGGEIETPNLDALAKQGLRYTQFYNTGRCWPTRAAVLTGYYAQQVRRDAVPGVKSGGQGTRPSWAKLLPELLQPLGYRSYHSGKWHVDGLPMKNGFARSYSLNDHDRHFAPKRHTEDDRPLPAIDPKTTPYYSTTAITDYAIQHLKEHNATYAQQPWFSFVAYTAPHFPLQAPKEDIEKYQQLYLVGWEKLRQERFDRQQELGLPGPLSAIEPDVGPPYAFPDAIKKLGPNEVNRPLPWATLTPEQQKFQAEKMAVHAAMVDRMDQEIGRILKLLKDSKQYDDTLILFLSDNGASAEIMVRGDGHDPCEACGTGATFLSLGPGWSSLCNTPFRRHKTWVHEGGISTPLIVSWPNGIKARNEIRTAVGHVIDLVPTLLELAGAEASLQPGAPMCPGISLVPSFHQAGATGRRETWWQHEGNRGFRRGDWKIVAAGADAPWELYDLATDRNETSNLAKDHPERLKELAALWTDQFEANKIISQQP